MLANLLLLKQIQMNEVPPEGLTPVNLFEIGNQPWGFHHIKTTPN